MIIQIPITPYSFKYLLKKYGPGPYDISGASKTNQIRLAYRYLHLCAEPTAPLKRIPGCHIALDLGNDANLHKLKKLNEDLLKAGLFFEHEFNQAMKGFIEAQRLLAEKKSMPMSEWSVSAALEDFLAFYEITEDEYSWESAYRKLTRYKEVDRIFFVSKLCKKFDFRASDNQYYKLAYLGGQKYKYIAFQCFSRSAEDIVMKRHRIPSAVSSWGKTEEYASTAIEVINDFLIRGYSVA